MNEYGSSRGKGCLAFIAFCVLMGAVVGLGFTLWQRTQDDALAERWKARGLPTTLAELDAWYEAVPDEENAALVFMAAADNFAPRPDGDAAGLPYLGGSESRTTNFVLTEELLPLAQEYLRQNAEAYELAHDAAKLPRARYPFDGNLGPSGVDQRHLSQVRDVARHLWLEALVRAREGDADRAIDSIEAAYALAGTVNDEPILIAQLVTVAVKQGTTQAASDAISATQFTAEQLDRLAALVAASAGRDGYYRAIVGESTYGLFDTSAQNPMSSSIFVWDRRAYAGFIESLLETAELTLPDAIARVDEMTSAQPSRLGYYVRPMSSNVAPAFARSFDSVARGEIYGELLQLVISVERYRLAKGAIPDELGVLAPEFMVEMPADPYSGESYRYLRDGEGYAVYSVGTDRLDGDAAKLGRNTGDIALHVTR